MSAAETTITPAVHHQPGVDLFNETWSLLDNPDRLAAEADLMIHAAHASPYHWQLSHVYAVLNRPEAALYHGLHCLDICQAEGIGDFDLAFAFESLARASAIDGQPSEARRYFDLAQEAGERIAEEDDRQYFFAEPITNTIDES